MKLLNSFWQTVTYCFRYAMKLANYHSVVLLNVQKIEAGNDMDADASEVISFFTILFLFHCIDN